MNIGTILATTDFSGGSAVSVRAAATLARQLGAELILHHVVESLPVFTYAQLGNFAVGGAAYDEQIRERARQELEELADELQQQGITCDIELGTGIPGVAIQEAADARHADLIVMATHGRTGFSHAMLGSVAEKVVRTATCPVMTLKAPGQRPLETFGELHIGRILYPTDLSPLSMRAIAEAADLADRFDAALEVLFVMEDPIHYPMAHWDYLPAETSDAFYDHQETAARDRLREVVDAALPDRPPPELHLRRGNAYQEIVDHAREVPISLIVMATHGRTGVHHAVVGSVAEKVVRLAHCPVVTHKVHAADE